MSSKLPSCQKDGDFQCLLTRKYLYYITRSQNCKQVVANAKFLKCISLAFFRTTYLHNLLTRCRRMASSPYLTYNLFAKRVVLKAQVVTQEPPKREKVVRQPINILSLKSVEKPLRLHSLNLRNFFPYNMPKTMYKRQHCGKMLNQPVDEKGTYYSRPT